MSERFHRYTLAEGSPAIGMLCPACREPMKLGEAITLVPIGPGENEEEREKARSGGYYNAVSLPAHYPCVTGKP